MAILVGLRSSMSYIDWLCIPAHALRYASSRSATRLHASILVCTSIPLPDATHMLKGLDYARCTALKLGAMRSLVAACSCRLRLYRIL
jgi:hypothetical protein